MFLQIFQRSVAICYGISGKNLLYYPRILPTEVRAVKKKFIILVVVLLMILSLVGPSGCKQEVHDRIQTGGNAITVTAVTGSGLAQPAIYVGEERPGTVLGYQGYCFAVEKGRAVLYKAGTEMNELASKALSGVSENGSLDLRLEIEDQVIRCFVLDDAAGVEPWPEIELNISSCEGFRVGCVDLAEKDTVFQDLQIRYYTPKVYEKTYTNPVYDHLADPEVIYEDGTFYLYGTGGMGYGVHTSDDLVNWGRRGTAVYGTLWGITRNYWAPDIDYVDGKYYMAVTCDEKLGFAVSDSLMGPFQAVGDAPLYEKTIDGHIFVDDDGRRYLYYVSWDGPYGIYGVELDEQMQPIQETATLLIRATDPWEQTEGSVAEGPYMLKHNGLYYLTYSGSGYTGIYYAVGYAVAESPLGTYEKYAHNPILVGHTQIHGVGHHSIVTIPQTGEMWMVYHCHNSLFAVQERKICIDRMRFSAVEGQPDRLEVYGPTVTPQPYPELE